MHDTALLAGRLFAEVYGAPGFVVVDIGGKDVNGTLRPFFFEKGMEYICVDIEPDKSVDIVIKPGDKLSFADSSVDLVVSTSCFEHDPCFWMTFREMCRIVKPDGTIYVDAPSNGPYHGYPGDNWRFYKDAGQALAYWSGIKINDEPIYPVKVVESFHISPLASLWRDYVCIWKRSPEKELELRVKDDRFGSLAKALINNKLVLT